MRETVVVLGLDPGSRLTGYGIIVLERSGQIEYLDAGVIRTNSNASLFKRLGDIYIGVTKLVERYVPQEAAVESVFVAKNIASALKLGQARGAAIAALTVAGLSVAEYAPSLVKQSLVGEGKADKKQVAFMVGRILACNSYNLIQDASDALAVALCHVSWRCYHTV